MEGDTFPLCPNRWAYHFNPLPPHGGRHKWDKMEIIELHFNPLPPHGGRHQIQYLRLIYYLYFNPLPPHGGRHFDELSLRDTIDISIHSLRMEGDL